MPSVVRYVLPISALTVACAPSHRFDMPLSFEAGASCDAEGAIIAGLRDAMLDWLLTQDSGDVVDTTTDLLGKELALKNQGEIADATLNVYEGELSREGLYEVYTAMNELGQVRVSYFTRDADGTVTPLNLEASGGYSCTDGTYVVGYQDGLVDVLGIGRVALDLDEDGRDLADPWTARLYRDCIYDGETQLDDYGSICTAILGLSMQGTAIVNYWDDAG